jgi:type 2 lantibiotic biosynthesis protein LanM
LLLKEICVDLFFDRLAMRAATIDELLSGEFETLPGQQGDADPAAKRIAAWCRSSVGGDWLLFANRLERDDLVLTQALARFATVRRRAGASPPAWIADAMWIDSALQQRRNTSSLVGTGGYPFEDVLSPLVDEADARLWARIGDSATDHVGPSARACLRDRLLDRLCQLCAPVLYDSFTDAREAAVRPTGEHYATFVTQLATGGLHRLFDEKPVLLRLIATLSRQWLDISAELVARICADVAAIRHDILHRDADCPVTRISGGLSDPHNGGRSVHLIEFEDGSRVMYKPKDLRIDVVWHGLVERLNRAGAPVDLRTPRALAREGYGWTEYVEHAGCADAEAVGRFFRRAGAWLAVFHCFAAADMHHENVIASGEHPVPIDLETLLQAGVEQHPTTTDTQATAYQAAKSAIADSVMGVGLLPSYARAGDDQPFMVGGMASEAGSATRLGWSDINSDTMRPVTLADADSQSPNLPHVEGRYARLGDHVDEVVDGFEDYATFLCSHIGNVGDSGLFDGFAGLQVRKVIRPTQFYHLLLHRLQDHHAMADGVVWSAQADFLARLADWDRVDPSWPLQRAERSAVLNLNVPFFAMSTDDSRISTADGISIETPVISGLQRARKRVLRLNAQEISWQLEVMRESLSAVAEATETSLQDQPTALVYPDTPDIPTTDLFLSEADRVAEHVSSVAIRRGSAAAWIGSGPVSDSEVSRLTVLGPDLYNGNCGIAMFFAAHAVATQRATSAEFALASLAQIRQDLKSRSAARLARSWGIGGATGLGSIVYGLTVVSKLLDDNALLVDAKRAAELLNDDLVEADNRLDVIGGSAGAILGLLRLYRDTGADDVLHRAVRCAEHLLAQPRMGATGCRSWRGFGPNAPALNGMSHGAAGFAYALASVGAATDRSDFAAAAAECVAFENSSYDAEHADWPDLRNRSARWRSQWCHGPVGIGFSRLAVSKLARAGCGDVSTDVQKALEGAAQAWPGHVDTLCCGSLGSVEFFADAGKALDRPELCDLAVHRLAAVVTNARTAGDYRWNVGARRFNVGLFRGLAGIGYTCLRRVVVLPNVLFWE